MSDNAVLNDREIKDNNIVERNMVVNGVSIHIKSIFNGKVPLDKALGNIAMRKISEKNRNK